MIEAAPFASPRRVEPSREWLLACLALFLVLSFVKAPRVLLDPRFWGEEGTLYFAQFRSLGAWDALLFVANGNYQLLTNVIVWLATKVPLGLAPAVTTYSAYLVQLLVVALIYVIITRYAINRIVGLLLVAAWALMPATYEIWASATNVQWTCSVSMLLILLLPHDDIRRHFKKIVLWTALCGLTGVTSCMLAPGFLVRAWLERSKRLALLGVLLCVCALIQLVLLKVYGVHNRAFMIGPRILTIPMLLQTVLTPLVGVGLVETLARPMRDGSASALSFAFVYLAGLSLMLVAVAAALRAQRAALVAIVTGLWVLVSVLNTFGAIGQPIGLVGALGGARYYLFGAMCFCLLLAFGTAAQAPVSRCIATALLAVIVATSVIALARGTWIAFFTEGPSWRAEIAKCDPAAPCRVAIWPRDWTVTLAPRP